MGFLLILIVNLVNMPFLVNTHTNCTILKDKFAASASEFVLCAILNARPVTLCDSCVQPYMDVIADYGQMKESLDNHSHCIDKYINLDRLQIIETLYINCYNLWNNAKCDQCFQFVDEKLTPNESDMAKNFYKYHEDFIKCVDQIGLNDTHLCSSCMNDYVNVNNFYSEAMNENESIGGCMDIVDLMNTTRSMWSQMCCKYRRHNESIFIASTIIVIITTLCFYVLVQLCSVEKAPTILQQRRFAEYFSQTTRS